MGKTPQRSGGLVRDIAVDLGTSTVRAAVRGRGILLREPAVAAVDRETGRMLRAGEEARQMLGRTPGEVLAVWPLAEGVPRDGALAAAMLREFLRKTAPGRVMKPRLLVGVPSGISPVDERALVEAGLQAGARRIYLMEEPLAAALGAGADVQAPRGRMVVDVGGGTTDVAVTALGGIAAGACLPAAGDAFDRALLQYIRQEHGLLIGLRTAEEVKRAAGRVIEETGEPVPVKGRCLTTGLPRRIDLAPEETVRALLPVAETIAAAVEEVLERTPPELAADVASDGILLTGGGSLLRGLDRLIAQRTGIPAEVAEDPEEAVIRGLELTLPRLSRMREGVLDLARRRAVAPG